MCSWQPISIEAVGGRSTVEYTVISISGKPTDSLNPFAVERKMCSDVNILG